MAKYIPSLKTYLNSLKKLKNYNEYLSKVLTEVSSKTSKSFEVDSKGNPIIKRKSHISLDTKTPLREFEQINDALNARQYEVAKAIALVSGINYLSTVQDILRSSVIAAELIANNILEEEAVKACAMPSSDGTAEFNQPFYMNPLLTALGKKDIIGISVNLNPTQLSSLVRNPKRPPTSISPNISVMVHTSKLGDEKDLAAAIEAGRKVPGYSNNTTGLQASHAWYKFMYLVNVVGRTQHKDKKGNLVDYSKEELEKYKDIYRATMKARAGSFGNKAPYWLLLEYGNIPSAKLTDTAIKAAVDTDSDNILVGGLSGGLPSDKGGEPMPAFKGTRFILKATNRIRAFIEERVNQELKTKVESASQNLPKLNDELALLGKLIVIITRIIKYLRTIDLDDTSKILFEVQNILMINLGKQSLTQEAINSMSAEEVNLAALSNLAKMTQSRREIFGVKIRQMAAEITSHGFSNASGPLKKSRLYVGSYRGKVESGNGVIEFGERLRINTSEIDSELNSIMQGLKEFMSPAVIDETKKIAAEMADKYRELWKVERLNILAEHNLKKSSVSATRKFVNRYKVNLRTIHEYLLRRVSIKTIARDKFNLSYDNFIKIIDDLFSKETDTLYRIYLAEIRYEIYGKVRS